MDCPFCHSAEVWQSTSRTAEIPWLLRFVVVCARCRQCWTKWYLRSRYLGGPKLRGAD